MIGLEYYHIAIPNKLMNLGIEHEVLLTMKNKNQTLYVI